MDIKIILITTIFILSLISLTSAQLPQVIIPLPTSTSGATIVINGSSNHNDLMNIQGGDSTNRWHLDLTQYNDLGDFATWLASFVYNYNQTTATYNQYGSQWYNHTVTANSTIYDTYNSQWSSGGNQSWNETYADDKYIPYVDAIYNVNLSSKNLTADIVLTKEIISGNYPLSNFIRLFLSGGYAPSLEFYVDGLRSGTLGYDSLTDGIILYKDNIGGGVNVFGTDIPFNSGVSIGGFTGAYSSGTLLIPYNSGSWGAVDIQGYLGIQNGITDAIGSTTISIDTNNRQLLANDGIIVSVDWSNGNLTTSQDIIASKFYGDGSKLTGINGMNYTNLALTNGSNNFNGNLSVIQINTSVGSATSPAIRMGDTDSGFIGGSNQASVILGGSSQMIWTSNSITFAGNDIKMTSTTPELTIGQNGGTGVHIGMGKNTSTNITTMYKNVNMNQTLNVTGTITSYNASAYYNYVVCYHEGGTLGHCVSFVEADGTCTCARN